MRTRTETVVAAVALGLAVGGCASGEQWNTWKNNSSHFASGDHAMYSLRNSPSNVKTTTADVEAARKQGGWWGRALGGPSTATPQATPQQTN